MPEPLSVQLASVPDRKRLVAEIWLGSEMIAEVTGENENLAVELYARRSGSSWSLDYEQLLRALSEAKARLLQPRA